MIAQSRGVQVFQGVISIILGAVSVLLAVMLSRSAYSTATLFTFFVVGLTLIFSGDYLVNPFGMPVNTFKQQLLSEMCLIAYGTFYLNIGISRLLKPLLMFNISHYLHPVWIRRGISTIGILLIIGGVYGIYQLRRTEGIESSAEET